MNKKGQFFMPLFFVITLIIFTTLYFDFTAKSKQFECKDFSSYGCKIGEKQLAIFKTAQDGEKTLLYIDIAAQYAYETALLETAKKTYISSESNCGYYRGTPIFYGKTDCMSYNEELENDVNAALTTSFNKALVPYLEAYQDNEIPQDNYVITVSGNTVKGIAKTNLEIPIFSYTSKPITEIPEETGITGSSSVLFSQWPVSLETHKITSCFGYRGHVSTKSGVQATVNHGGIDIGAPKGTPVIAIADGVVTTAEPFKWGYVIVDHGDGISSQYLHMDTVLVTKGENVKKGQQVGTVGGRGANGDPNAYAPHLHFSILDSNIDASLKDEEGNAAVIGKEHSVNPLCYLSSDVTYTYYNNLGCRSQGGVLKFCSLYHPVVTTVISSTGTITYTPSKSAKEMLLQIQTNYGSLIEQAMVGKTIPKALVYGLMAQESSGNPQAGSKTGCMGLMQFCSGTAHDYGLCGNDDCSTFDYRTDPTKAIPAGISHLQSNVDEFSQYTDKLKFGAAAYNAGGAVIQCAIKKTEKNNPLWEDVSAALDASCINYKGSYYKTTEHKNEKVIEIQKHVPFVMGYYATYEQLQNTNDIKTNP